MVVSDHIVGRSSLVNWGARLVEEGGSLQLVHVEDDAVFARYVDAIGRIPDIDTEVARQQISARLLHEARSYLERAAEVVKAQSPL